MDELFPLAAPPIGSPIGAVRVGDRSLHLEHRMLHSSVSLPLTDVAAVVHLTVHEKPPVLARKARTLSFSDSALMDDNVLIVLRRPATAPAFKFGADHANIGITARERRKGASFDAFTLRLADPSPLIAALAGRGVRVETSSATALLNTFGPGSPEDHAAARRATRRVAFTMAIATLAFTCTVPIVLSYALSGQDDATNTWTTYASVAVGTTLLLAAVIAALPIRSPPRPISGRVRWDQYFAFAVPGLLALVAWGLSLRDSGRSDAWPIIVLSAIASGIVLGTTLRWVRTLTSS